MDIPFKFRILESNNPFLISNSLDDYPEYNNYFFTEEKIDSIKDEQMISITENTDITIEFNSVKGNARVYMDTLDYYQSSICKEDENGNIYIDESPEPIVLFKNAKSDKDYYPFIPGTYQIYVTLENEKYYALINVQPKQLTPPELDLMREEIEETIENLAHMLVTNKNISKMIDSSLEEESISNKLLILMNYYNKIIPTLKEIQQSPRYKIINHYYLEGIDKVKIIDQETIKHRLKKCDNQNRLLVPKREITRDLPENTIIIKIIKYIQNVARTINQYIENLLPHIEYDANLLVGGKFPRPESEYSKYIHQIESLQNSKQKIKKMLTACNIFLQTEWVNEVVEKATNNNSTGLYLDNRYRLMYKVYRELQHNKKIIQLDSAFSYRWKRTDKLYEMWGFIKFLKALQSPTLGFQPVKGWIYDDDEILSSWKVPLLKEGETITLISSDNKVIKLVYDKPIVYDKKLTSFEDPLYTQFPNNRPDTRIDFYDNDRYEASFIIDFKYRPAHSIGNLKVDEYTKDSTVYKQILHYSKFDSEFVRKTKDYVVTDKTFRTTPPVAGVWVVFPNHISNNEANKQVSKKDWLTKIPFSPGESIEKLENIILEALKQESLI